jgi:hypothetical protein
VIDGDNVVGLDFHHNVTASGAGSVRLTGSGNVFSNSFLTSTSNISGSAVLRHVTNRFSTELFL